MNPADQISDDELQAWVDDRLPSERQAAVEARLQQDPDAAARAAAYRAQTEDLRAAMQTKFGAPTPARLQAATVLAEARRRAFRPAQAAAMAAALLIGVAAGSIVTLRLTGSGRDDNIRPAGVDTIQAEAIAAHLTYVVDARHPVEVGAAERLHLVQWLSRRLGKPLVAPDLEAVGYRLMGGRLLPAGDGPAAQLMYEDADGKRITVYLRADPRGEETAFRFAEAGGVNGFQWSDRGFGYVLFGDVDRDHLLQAAKAIYHETSAV